MSDRPGLVVAEFMEHPVPETPLQKLRREQEVVNREFRRELWFHFVLIVVLYLAGLATLALALSGASHAG